MGGHNGWADCDQATKLTCNWTGQVRHCDTKFTGSVAVLQRMNLAFQKGSEVEAELKSDAITKANKKAQKAKKAAAKAEYYKGVNIQDHRYSPLNWGYEEYES